jgi:hypothetical protein
MDSRSTSSPAAIVVRTDKPVDPADVPVLGGHRLQTSIAGDLLTAGVPPSVTAPRPRPPVAPD